MRPDADNEDEVELPRPKHLRLRLDSAPPVLVPARMVNEVLYCERLAYLEWAQKEFADNFFTVEGRTVVHRRVDQGAGRLVDPPERDDAAPKLARRKASNARKAKELDEPAASAPWTAQSIWLSSIKLRLIGKIDLVRGNGGVVSPVEYKRGSRPDVAEGAWLPERAQLCAQVLLLRDAGYQCDEAFIWYAKSREKVPIRIDDHLIDITKRAIARVREITTKAQLPPPLEGSPKCVGCSLSGLCLPDEVALLNTTEARRRERKARTRRLHPANDERVPLYVQEHGAKIGLSKSRLSVKSRDGNKTYVRLPNTSQVCLFGNVQVTTQAMRELLARGIPVAFFSTGGWFIGRTQALESKNVELRVAQYRAYLDEPWRLRFSRSIVRNKILNQRTMLRRNGDVDEQTLFELKQLARKCEKQDARASLLGIEGSAARVYFQSFEKMLKQGGSVASAFRFETRNRRPPTDPLNAMLSFAYSLLTKEWALACATVGLDPMLGFFHETRFGRPALALDLMEPFRPIVADSIVISLINNGEIEPKDFVVSRVGCALRPHARKRMIAAHERRMKHEITHPVFGYRISYRRVLEVQARLLGRHLLAEIADYPEFRTR